MVDKDKQDKDKKKNEEKLLTAENTAVFDELMVMPFHTTWTFAEGQILRVPGGWIYSPLDDKGEWGQSSVFISQFAVKL